MSINGSALSPGIYSPSSNITFVKSFTYYAILTYHLSYYSVGCGLNSQSTPLKRSATLFLKSHQSKFPKLKSTLWLLSHCNQVSASFSNLDTASLTILMGLAIPTNTLYCLMSNNYNIKAASLLSNFEIIG